MCAERLGIGREAQDEHAISSVERARAAVAAGDAGLQPVPLGMLVCSCSTQLPSWPCPAAVNAWTVGTQDAYQLMRFTFPLAPAGLVDWEIVPMEVPGKGGAVALMKEVRVVVELSKGMASWHGCPSVRCPRILMIAEHSVHPCVCTGRGDL